MPVIAFNTSKIVYDWYNDIKSGKRSKVITNRLERSLRLEEPQTGQMSFQRMEAEYKSVLIGNESLQSVLTTKCQEIENLTNEIEMLRSKSLFQRIFRWN